MSRLYVGNLNPGITKEKLGDAFNRFGPIVEIWYNPESGYAFVEFESPRDASSAIRRMNKRRFHGVDLRVEPTKYRKKEYKGGNNTRSKRDGVSRFVDRRVHRTKEYREPRRPSPVYSDSDDEIPPKYAPRPDRRYYEPPKASPSPERSPSGGHSPSSTVFDPSKPLTIKSNQSAPKPSPCLPIYRSNAESDRRSPPSSHRVRISDYRHNSRSFDSSNYRSNSYHGRGSPSSYRTRSRSPPPPRKRSRRSKSPKRSVNRY